MNLFIAAILKIVLLEALLAGLWAAFFFERSPRSRRGFQILFSLLLLLSALAYYNFGFFRGWDRAFIHPHEQYHFVLGSKYLEEIRYDQLYRASVVAADEEGKRLTEKIRDPMSFKMEQSRPELWREEVKARFSPERWLAFKADLSFYLRGLEAQGKGCEEGCSLGQRCLEGRCRSGYWQVSAKRVLHDHGNTGSPAWAMLASLFTRLIPLSPGSAKFFGALDSLLLLALFLLLWRSFGLRAASVGFIFALLPLRAYDWLGGSLLRLDWLFVTGAALAAWQQRRPKLAGLLLGYAIITKLFVALFALGLGSFFLFEALRQRKIERAWVEVVLYAFLGLGGAVLLSSLYFGDFGLWQEYGSRILVTLHERYYSGQYSFRDLFLQLRAQPLDLLKPVPEQIQAALPSVNIAEHSLSFLLARGLLLLGLLWTLWRQRDPILSFGFGAFFIFVALVSNLYYWQMLLFPALALAREGLRSLRRLLILSGLIIFLMTQYIFVHFGALRHAQGYFGSWSLSLLCLGIISMEIGALLRKKLRRGSAPESE